MEIEGTIIRRGEYLNGVSRGGNEWQKQEWIMETVGKYPKQVQFSTFGDHCNTLKFEIGRRYRISMDIESKEYAGRWYTNLTAYNAQLLQD
ncbi:MAG: DUF3127 domain-containing protein [Candidatus Amulumruptor caecigallinarius]|nr:DUF3127 domain-containing protein [Candidatus Amulumruptor caecigallinarius]